MSETSAYINTLSELLAEAKSRIANGNSQRAVLEWVAGLAAPLGIRMRHDEWLVPPAHRAPSGSEAGADTGHGSDVGEPEVLPSSPPTEDPACCGASAPDRLRRSPEGTASPSGTATRSCIPSDARTRKKSRPRPMPATVGRDGRLYFPSLMTKDELKNMDATSRFAFLSDGDQIVGRIILSCDRHNVQVDVPLCAESNGAVIDAITWNLLASPPRAFNPRPKSKTVDRHLSNDLYDLIRVDDGTVVTIYAWNHPTCGRIWCMSTGNGYDVSSLKWMGTKTYAEVVAEVLDRYASEEVFEVRRGILSEHDVRLEFKKLDPRYCYTVGFRHASFHPLPTDAPRMWQIQRTRLDTGLSEFGSEGLPGVPHQRVCDAKALVVGAPTVDKLLATCKDALSDAKKHIAREGALADERGVSLEALAGDGRDLLYGYILRSRNPSVTCGHSDILLESPLLRRVRQFVYRKPPRAVRDDLDHTTRLEFNALQSFLNLGYRDEFLGLFPQFKNKYQLYENFIDNIISLIITMQRQAAMKDTGGPISTKKTSRSPTATVAMALHQHIIQNDSLNAFHKNAKSLVHDYVVQPQYTLLYLRAMHPSPLG